MKSITTRFAAALGGVVLAVLAANPVSAQTDLSIFASDNPDPVISGQNTVYTLQVVNLSLNPAANVVVTNYLPPDFTFVDAQITGGGTSTQKTPVIGFNEEWRYEATGTDLGTGWRAPGFDDSGWPIGEAALAYETGATAVPINTQLYLTNAAGTSNRTYYFRTSFVYTNPTANAQVNLILRNAIDDGAVFYLNGQEVFRTANMPAGTISYSTFASSAASENVIVTNVVPVTNLVAGANVVAVEVHQNSATSSDIVFASAMDLEVITGATSYQVIGSTVVFNLSTLPSGATAIIALTAKAGASSGSLTNVAEVASSTPETNLGNNLSREPTTVNLPPPADLGLSIADSPDPVEVGANLVYALSITNYGPAWATNVVVTNTLAPNVTFLNANIVGASSITQSVKLVQMTDAWKYNQTGADLGTAWRDNGFDDSQWPSGAALLYNESSALPFAKNTQLSLTNASGAYIYTFYFRKEFVYSGPTDTVQLYLTNVIDDGAIFYLNGQEIFRTNLPAGDVEYDTQSNVNVGNGATHVALVTVTNLVQGPNLLAVEVHQNGTNSSDVAFGAAVDALLVSVGSYINVGNQVVFSLGNLAPSTVATIRMTVRPNVAGQLNNQAVVSSIVFDNQPQNNTASAITQSSSAEADLAVGMADQPDPVIEGHTFTNTISLLNRGPDPTINVRLTNVVSGGATLLSASSSSGNCSVVAREVRCDWAALGVGTQATVTVVLRGDVLGMVTNNATVVAGLRDPNSANNTALETTRVITSLIANLRVTAVASPDPVIAGEGLTNLVTIMNTGPSNATSVVLTNLVQGPQSLNAVRLFGPGIHTNLGNGLVVAYFTNIAAGQSVTASFELRATGPGRITNSASAYGQELDLNLGDNTAVATTTVNPAPVVDLVVVGQAVPSPVFAGDNLVFNLGVANVGTLPASGVVLTNVLPPEVTFVSATNSFGACSNYNGTVVCDLGNLAGGGTASVSLVVRPFESGTITNLATVSSAQSDFNPADNSAATTVLVLAGDEADLVLGVNLAPTNVFFAGQEVTLRIGLTNRGPLTATGVFITNWLPAGVSFLRANVTQGSFANLDGAMVFQVGALLRGGGMSASVVVRADQWGSLNNVAVAAAHEPDPATNYVKTVIKVNPSADLMVSVGESSDPVSSASVLTYTVTVINNGPSAASGVNLYDYLPVGAVLQGVFASKGAFTTNNGVVLWNIGNLAAGASAVMDIDVLPGEFAMAVSSVGVLASEHDPVSANNSLVVTTTILSASGGQGIVVTANTNANALAAAITASGATGIKVNSVALQAHQQQGAASSGLYVVTSTNAYNLSLPGVIISTGNVSDYSTGPNLDPGKTTGFGRAATTAQEALLDPITGGGTNDFKHFDVTQLDIYFDMLAGYDRVSFKVVFGSDEYEEFVGSSYIDGFGIYLDGTNIAYAAGAPININHPDMMALPETELDGVIVLGGTNSVLTFSAPVAGGSTGHKLTFIVADTSDTVLDTTVYISSLEGVVGANADLAMTVTAVPEPVRVGDLLTYSITVSNGGPTTATNTVLTQMVPSVLTNINVEASGATFELTNGTLHVFLGDLPRRGIATLTVSGYASVDARFVSFIEVKSDLTDLNGGDNSAFVISTATELGSFYSPQTIVIRDGALASPYPSTLTIAGVTGVVDRLTVSLLDLSHTFPADINVLLVAPNGRGVVLMAGAGWLYGVNNVSLRFDDTADELLPRNGAIESGVFRPSNLSGANSFPGLPGIAPYNYGSQLSALRRSPANGEWKLYVYDNQGGDAGIIAAGWNLRLTTVPELSIEVAGDNLVISWHDLAGYVLQGTASLSGAPAWSPVNQPSMVSGDMRMVVVPVSSGLNFFRLQKP